MTRSSDGTAGFLRAEAPARLKIPIGAWEAADAFLLSTDNDLV